MVTELGPLFRTTGHKVDVNALMKVVIETPRNYSQTLLAGAITD
jgi:hypothetical protein